MNLGSSAPVTNSCFLPLSSYFFFVLPENLLRCCSDLLHHCRSAWKYICESYILEQWSISVTGEQVSVSMAQPPIFQCSGPQSVAFGPATSMSPGNLLGIHTLGPHPRHSQWEMEWSLITGVNKPSKRCYCVLTFENCCPSGMTLSWLPHIFSDCLDGFEPQFLTVVSWPVPYPSLTLVSSPSHIPYLLICTSEDHLTNKLLSPKPLFRVCFQDITNSRQKPSIGGLPYVGCFVYIISLNRNRWGN